MSFLIIQIYLEIRPTLGNLMHSLFAIQTTLNLIPRSIIHPGLLLVIQDCALGLKNVSS